MRTGPFQLGLPLARPRTSWYASHDRATANGFHSWSCTGPPTRVEPCRGCGTKPDSASIPNGGTSSGESNVGAFGYHSNGGSRWCRHRAKDISHCALGSGSGSDATSTAELGRSASSVRHQYTSQEGVGNR